MDADDEGTAVGMAATARVPVAVCHLTEARILTGQRVQGSVDCLLFGGDQADADLALLKREDLGAQHRGIGDANQVVDIVIRTALGDDEEPGAIW